MNYYSTDPTSTNFLSYSYAFLDKNLLDMCQSLLLHIFENEFW